MLDSAFLGVIVGSGLSIVVNFFSHYFTMQKEEKQWERQQASEENRRKLDEEKQIKQSIIDIYHNCISRLSFLVASENETLKISPEERLQLYKDAFHWLALLEVQKKDRNTEDHRRFQNEVRMFLDDPDVFAGNLLESVRKIAMFDHVLSPNPPTPEKRDNNNRRVQVDLDESFRREQAIQGKELLIQYMFDCDLKTLTPKQREKLWDAYSGNSRIPDTIYLSVPKFNEHSKKIELKGWKARLDPTSSSPEKIFFVGEREFETSLKSAQEAEATLAIPC